MNCDSLLSFFWVVFKFFVLGVGGVGFGGGEKLRGTFPLSIVAGLNLPATSRSFLFLFPQKIAKFS